MDQKDKKEHSNEKNASDNIYYSEPYKSNFQFGKQHIIESYCNLHDVEFDVNMKPKL